MQRDGLARDGSRATALGELAPVLHALGDRRVVAVAALDFEKCRSACPLRFSTPRPRLRGRLKLRQRAPIFARHDLDEMLQRVRPVGEQRRGLGAAGRELMALEQDAQPFGIVAERMAHAVVMDARRVLRRRAISPRGAGRSDAFERDALEIALALQRAFGIVDIGDAARHARGEVAADRAKHARPRRRSYIRSNGRRRPRPPRPRPNCAPRSARRRRPRNRPRPRSRRKARYCRR